MSSRSQPIAQAWLETPDSGVIELSRDWFGHTLPPVGLGVPPRPFRALRPAPPVLFGDETGYFVNNRNELHFLLRPERHPGLDPEVTTVLVAGDFNGWGAEDGSRTWTMERKDLGGGPVLVLTVPAERVCTSPRQRFKFRTVEGRWLEVPPGAPNAVLDDQGNRNYEIDPDRTGRHRFVFETAAPLELSENHVVVWRDADGEQRVPLRPAGFFFQLRSEQALGALVGRGETVFRLFAPRARRVRLKLLERLDQPDDAHLFPLERQRDGTWEVRLDRDLHGWYYWYFIEGPANVFGHFDRARPVVDPYARALVDREGPGIVLADRFFPPPAPFRTPQWQDLVIAEAHVRDLAARAPVALPTEERRGFAGLRRWVESPRFYLKQLGVNAVELQPVQEFDNAHPDEYHWGYMPVNWFAPESSYGSDPARASQVAELRELVEAFHRQGIAVLLDVVYNHVGEPGHLLFIDKHYYFVADAEGRLSNWSGCGNDLRCDAAMMRRLIIDSCTHLIRAYGIDGFRFDLAELIGVEALREIEAALKRVKPDVILIAEPWSFRGHIAGALAETGWASWNDGFRNFARDYVRGHGTREAFEYFVRGSPWYFARWPAQTVNYTESHDDRTWIDVITEQPDGNGSHPTINDRRRTHLMAALLFASIGMPMIAAGQDFLRSKQGVHNTYLRGDLNALDYRRIHRFPATHRYFVDWIRFRRSETGRLLRLYSRPGEGYFRFLFDVGGSAAAVVYNADRQHGPLRLLFAINPHLEDVVLPLGEVAGWGWRQLADHEQFFRNGEGDAGFPLEGGLYLPPLGCGLWVAEG